jgi:hypothetical protein
LRIAALVAFVYSIVVVWGGAWLVVTFRSRSFPSEELLPLLMQTVIAFLPFAILLLVAKHRRRHGTDLPILKALISGFAFSILLWSYFYYYAITYDGRTGVPYGLLMAMLFSPVIVYIPMHFVLNRVSVKPNVG